MRVKTGVTHTTSPRTLSTATETGVQHTHAGLNYEIHIKYKREQGMEEMAAPQQTGTPAESSRLPYLAARLYRSVCAAYLAYPHVFSLQLLLLMSQQLQRQNPFGFLICPKA